MRSLYAYFMTWPTYGSWLPGDERGWVKYRHGYQDPNPALQRYAAKTMAETQCLLSSEQRMCVEQSVQHHCAHRGWTLFAVNCRSNHIHVLLFGADHTNEIRQQLKTWSTRNLKKLNPVRSNWWAERGSCLYIRSESELLRTASYVNDGQEVDRKALQVSKVTTTCNHIRTSRGAVKG